VLAAWLRCVCAIQCRDAEGQITYQGRYDQETPRAYIVEVVEENAYTRDFWPKSPVPEGAGMSDRDILSEEQEQ
jgi:hypothetical protein